MNKKISITLAIVCAFSAGMVLQYQQNSYAQEKKVYELRTYTTAPGRLPALLNRFGGGEVDLFVKHGMTTVGYWVPDAGQLSQSTLVYMVAHADRKAAVSSWSAFSDDPVWHEMRDKSREDGPIVTNVVNQFLDPTNFSPAR